MLRDLASLLGVGFIFIVGVLCGWGLAGIVLLPRKEQKADEKERL